MNSRPNCFTPGFGVLGLVLLLRAAPIEAASIRVTTWDLQPSASAGANGWSNQFQQRMIQEAAGSLKKLDPDVIILQQVADWQTCRLLAQAMQPENYQVAICSAFRDPRTKLPGRQVAILSKVKAYLSWSEPWQNSGESPTAPGGYAFAAIKLGDKNIGIFSVQLADGASAAQLLQQIASVQNWKANRLQAFVAAGDFSEKILSRLEQIGFENDFVGPPLQKRGTVDDILSRGANLIASPLITQSSLAEYSAVTCVMDLTAPPPPVQPTVSLVNRRPTNNPRISGWYAVFPAVCLVLFLLVRKLLRRSPLQPAPAISQSLKAKTGARVGNPRAGQIIATPPSESAPYVQIETESSTQTQSQTWPPRAEAGRVTARMPEAVREGVIANLSRWLKQKVVQRLVSDRAQLLATQEAAALKMVAVDERLAKVEQQIQQRNQDYERRIDDLLKALITAEEENRELIRAQITLLKAEMERGSLKVGQGSHEDEHY